MAHTIAQRNTRTRPQILLRRTPEAMDEALKKTSGLWRGRKIDPVRYQKEMRKSYATEKMR